MRGGRREGGGVWGVDGADEKEGTGEVEGNEGEIRKGCRMEGTGGREGEEKEEGTRKREGREENEGGVG